MVNRIKLLYLVWLLVFIILIAMFFNYRSESTQFYGIADTREIIVNSEHPVELKKIHVVAGQVINKGELLVELNRPDLTMRINEITHQIEDNRAQNIVTTAALRSQIAEFKGQRASRTNEITYQIKELQAQYNINKKLTAELGSVKQDEEKVYEAGIDNPLKFRIEGLQKELELAVNPLQITISMLEKELKRLENPFKVLLEELGKELDLLLKEKNNLYVFAQLNGIIGSVNFKEGEKISPFMPILTLHAKSPSYVQGFIHENAYNRIAIGNKTEIVSLADSSNSIQGEVVGVGSRIVEFPERLRKSPDVLVWGREVLIKIPEDNNFLLGEKVLVSSTESRNQSSLARFENISSVEETHAKKVEEIADTSIKTSDPTDIMHNETLKTTTPVEASGVLYLKDLKKYLIVSDTTENQKPVLYLMNDEGIIEEEIIIQGLKKINDMEAITESDDGTIYLACSQHASKKGKVPDEKKLLLRIRRDNAVLILDKKVYLYDLLQDAAQHYINAEWAKFITPDEGKRAINIEGIFHHEGNLYLGFKKPLQQDTAVIVKINDIDDLFEGNKLGEESVELWKAFDLRDKQSGAPTGISDLYIFENRVFILSYVKTEKDGMKKKSGNLWSYDLERNKLVFIIHFEQLKPEGITFNPDKGEFLITFDGGTKNPSKMMKVRNL